MCGVGRAQPTAAGLIAPLSRTLAPLTGNTIGRTSASCCGA